MATPTSVAVIGAGPAGLTAAYLLGKRGAKVVVLEEHPTHVGGIARTESYKGYRFDIGGHRFFSKSKPVEDLWTELLGNDLLVRPRTSRIYYGGKYFSYPLKGAEALQKLGPFEALRCLASYAKAQAFRVENPRTLEQWVSNQFGTRLFEIFFKTYTEKVWGIPCSEISADWAAQRIKGLSMMSALKSALFPQRGAADRGKTIKTLIDTFRYPRLGPGMMWEEAARRVQAHGNEVRLGRKVTRLSHETGRWIVTATSPAGDTETVEAEHVVSTAPLQLLARGLAPDLSAAAGAAAESLRYRDFIIVCLILEDRGFFDDNWIYIHDPGVKVGRVQNFKAWSPQMVPDPKMCCYGLEYFCFEGDGLWTAKDAELVALAKREVAQIGLVPEGMVEDGCVVRQLKAYPTYDAGYADRVEVLRRELKARYPTLHPVGRNGMHKYNNQDHSMMTAMLAVENILAGRELADPWRVNEDAEYHEEGESTSGLRQTPQRAG